MSLLSVKLLNKTITKSDTATLTKNYTKKLFLYSVLSFTAGFMIVVIISEYFNPNGLYEVKDGLFVETPESGKPVVGRGEIRSGLLEQANTDFKANMADYQQAKVQMELVNALIKSNKDLLQSAMEMATQ